MHQRAVLAGGCFWGMQDLIRKRPGVVSTRVGDFWEAEPEHQDYQERYPNGYTCHFPRPNWILPTREIAG